MKKILFSLLIPSLFVSVVHATTPQCYGDAGVSAEVPYILTLTDLNEFALNSILEDLTDDQMLKVENVLNFGSKTLAIIALSVDTTKVVTVQQLGSEATAINAAVAEKVQAVASKYELKTQNVSLECNGIVTLP